MQEGLNNNQTPANNINTPVVPQKENEQKLKIVQTDEGQKNDLYRCPKCGATEISLNPNTGKLRCSFCRHEFDYEKPEGLDQDIKNLEGIVMGSGTQDIVADTKDVMTFKCSSCGAEVVIDTSSSLQARCHWCRNTLSLNQQIPNGAVPDVVLPFSVTKDIAKEQIEKFVGKRRFFAAKRFQEEFTTQNIMGVYFPYMVIDVNAHAKLVGQGEHLVRSYRRSVGNRDVTYYDADLYDVGREFDVTIDDLTVESSKDKLDKKSETKTNNIINAIMPFDTENAVKWNANYIKGFSSEKRDTNVSDLAEIATAQAKDVVIHSANVTLDYYNRGVMWTTQDITVKGQQWKSAYLPVWLYSYQEENNGIKTIHYVAVNGRTKETMGSVPLNMGKLIFFSILVEIPAILAVLSMSTDDESPWILLLAGFIFFAYFYDKYRNKNARHKHEVDTNSTISNLKEYDKFVEHRIGLMDHRMNGANNEYVSGDLTPREATLNSLSEKSALFSAARDLIEDSNKKNNNKNNSQ